MIGGFSFPTRILIHRINIIFPRMQFWGHKNMHSFSAGPANIARFALYNIHIHDIHDACY